MGLFRKVHRIIAGYSSCLAHAGTPLDTPGSLGACSPGLAEGDSIAAITKLDEAEEEVVLPEGEVTESNDSSDTEKSTDNTKQSGEETEPPVTE